MRECGYVAAMRSWMAAAFVLAAACGGEVDAGEGRAVAEEARPGLHPALEDTVFTRVLPAMEAIPLERRSELLRLSTFVRNRIDAGEPARLTFICTHNSRRSHMAQVWAATAAAWYGIEGVETYSGGTEATAFNPRAVAALERAGFEIANPGGDNPRYRVRFGPDAPPLTCFSKVTSESPNPREGFAAIMTCSAADEACPIVDGAALRVSIPYIDPKEADDTPEETARYDARSLQIAAEMFYLMSRVRE